MKLLENRFFYSNIIMNFNYENKNEELLIYGYEMNLNKFY